jgi:hypothetical protein
MKIIAHSISRLPGSRIFACGTAAIPPVFRDSLRPRPDQSRNAIRIFTATRIPGEYAAIMRNRGKPHGYGHRGVTPRNHPPNDPVVPPAIGFPTAYRLELAKIRTNTTTNAQMAISFRLHDGRMRSFPPANLWQFMHSSITIHLPAARADHPLESRFPELFWHRIIPEQQVSQHA